MARRRQTTNKKTSKDKTETKPDQLVKHIKTISERVADIAKSRTKSNFTKLFDECAKIVSERLTGKPNERRSNISSRSFRPFKIEQSAPNDVRRKKKTSGLHTTGMNFEIEVIRLLNQINASIKKNDIPSFLDKNLANILHNSHIKNVIWDENRADNRASGQNKSNKELLDAIKNIKSSSVTSNKSVGEKPETDDEQGNFFSKLLGLGTSGVSALIYGSTLPAAAIYYGTGGDNPNAGQAAVRTGVKAGIKYGTKKIKPLPSKISAKRIGVLRKMAKDPATKIIHDSVKNANKTLPKGGILGKIASRAKPAMTKVAKLSGTAKAAKKVGIKGLTKAGKLATKAKWLGRAGKLAKFGGKALPGVGLVLGGMEAFGHFKKGNYLRGAMSLGSGILGMVPGLGTAAAIGLDVAGGIADVADWSAKKRKEVNEKKREAKAKGQKPELTFSDRVGLAFSDMYSGEILSKSMLKTSAGRNINDALDMAFRIVNPGYNMARIGYENAEEEMYREKMANKKKNAGEVVTATQKNTELGKISSTSADVATKQQSTKTIEIKHKTENKPVNPRFGRNTPRAQTHQEKKQVNPRFKHDSPGSQKHRVTRPEPKPKMEKPQTSQKQKDDKLGSTFTDEMKKSRDASEAQSKQITQSFKDELEKVCVMLAQINATLPALQPAPPPPVQQIMEGNKVPEFRKHNLEAIA